LLQHYDQILLAKGQRVKLLTLCLRVSRKSAKVETHRLLGISIFIGAVCCQKIEQKDWSKTLPAYCATKACDRSPLGGIFLIKRNRSKHMLKP